MSSSDGKKLLLETVVIAMTVPEPALARLRAEFPSIRFIVPGEEKHPDGRFRIEPAAPSDDDLRQADGLIGWDLDAAMLDVARRLRWFHAASAGIEHFDLPAIADRGLVMTNASGVCAPNMAEHVLGMMIALARRFPQLTRAQARREWRDTETHSEVSELNGQTVLIAGLGEIGREVATRAAAFGMRVDGLRRRTDAPRPAAVERVFATESLATAVRDADHVVVTLPDTSATRGLFGTAAFAAMKRGARIYNVGRGPVIDTAALVAALRTGHLGGAGLDVTDPEPLPPESPLWDMDNVIITAHTSGATPRFWDRQGALIAETIHRIECGERPKNLVDPRTGY